MTPTPTPTTFFAGQNLIGGVLSTGQTVFASFKPILILIIGVFAGFFVIYLLIVIIRGAVMRKVQEANYFNQVVEQEVIVHYKQDVAKVMNAGYKANLTPEELAESIKDLTDNYRQFINLLKSKK
jgi:hypothetical protein